MTEKEEKINGVESAGTGKTTESETDVDIEKKLGELEERNQYLENRVKELEEYARRLKANFDNYVLQSQKERERILKTSNEYMIQKMLPVLENFERALAHGNTNNLDSIKKGLEMIYRQFKNVLESEGLLEISPDIGEVFDPYYHEAVEKVETSEFPEHSIVEVVEKGYKLSHKVLKPAKVKVAVVPATAKKGEGEDKSIEEGES
ncbi:MAG: nucleotide exchange factor GrpE [Thermotogae bacterium]|nr:nucleotide exchange factor GrpE [Thermotogota bacterium]